MLALGAVNTVVLGRGPRFRHTVWVSVLQQIGQSALDNQLGIDDSEVILEDPCSIDSSPEMPVM